MMNRDDMIEKAARAMAADRFSTPDAWNVYTKAETTRDDYRRAARAVLVAVGALPPEPEPEPLPDQQVRIDPDGWVWQKLTTAPAINPEGTWRTSGPPAYPLTDDRVRDWPVMEVIDDAPEASKATIDAESLADWLWGRDTNDSYGEDAETWVERAAREIRTWADEHGHRPPVPEGHVTVDLSGYSDWLMKEWTTNRPPVDPLADAAGAELARRGEQE